MFALFIILSVIISIIIVKIVFPEATPINKAKVRHKCKNCSFIYPPMDEIQWVVNFRTDFHKDPETNKTCYWMLFKDGSQTHDYPGE